MSKKVNFSIKNDEFKELEKVANEKGKKVIEIIKMRYNKGKKIEKSNNRINSIIREIKSLKNENDLAKIKQFAAIEVLIRQNIFSNEVLNLVVKNSIKEEDKQKEFEILVSQKCEEKIDKLKEIFFGEH